MRRRFFIVTMLATAWLGFTQPSRAQGTIAYYQPATPILLWSQGFSEFYPLDFDGDGNADFTFGYNFQFLGVRSEGLNRLLILQDPPPNVGGPIAPLPAGFSIGSGSESGALAWSSGFGNDFEALAYYFNGVASGPFAGQHAYMGLEFRQGASTYYGWALLQISGDYAAIGQIESWAWETQPGVPIFAGAVPEPSTWTLLGLGIVMLAWRKRKLSGGRCPSGSAARRHARRANTADPGAYFHLLSSTDLVTWQTNAIVKAEGVTNSALVSATQPYEFYRLRRQQ